MNEVRTPPVVIAAGGTGGHVLPAEALADRLIQRGQRVILLTDSRSRPQDSAVFRSCEQHIIGGSGVVGRSPIRAARSIARIAGGVLQARRIMAAAKPRVVVGFGGYPSVAPVLAARTLSARPKIVLHDQNAALGRANQLLARFADVLALSFADTQGVPPGCVARVTGNPVRTSIIAKARAPYHDDGTQLNLLVMGGSLGALAFATLVPEALALLPERLRSRLQIIMQCPSPGLALAQERLAQAGIKAVLAPFIENVALEMARSQLVIARAGGSTVAEIAVIGRPAILIPLAINADQRANAQSLVRAGGAIRLDQANLTASAFSEVLAAVLGDSQKRVDMARAAASFGITDAADQLAALVMAEIVQ
jgi:UDP-N-acetylglucosamine--N-acetylmuramyl-(pentapeptide) pyrophosphoryl-undecaprenol N-acetylglucosamine transferase